MSGAWRHAETILAAIATAVAFVMACWIHSFFMASPSAIGFDEGYIAAIGERMIDCRWLPYVDGASHRGPLLYWATALAEALAGRFSWTALRVLCLVCTVATVVGCFGVGLAARLPLAGAVGALVHAYFAMFVLTPGTGIALNGETVAAPFAVGALLLATRAIRGGVGHRRAVRLVAASGACASLAMLAKQTAIVVAPPLVLWIAAHAWSSPSLGRRGRRRLLGAFAAGWVAPVAVVVARYAVEGELGTFWYWFYGYNAHVYMRPYAPGSAQQIVTDWVTAESIPLIAVCLVLVWSLAKAAAPLARWRSGGVADRYAAVGLEATAALLAALTLAAAMAPLRFWGHYFLVVSPWFALLVGIRGELAIDTEPKRDRVARHALVVLLLAGFVGWSLHARLNGLRNERARGQWGPAAPDPLCDAVDRHSKRRDPIFIWGFDGDLYVTCRRVPASRFTYTTLVAGIVPPFWNVHRRDLVARGARETLAGELETARPPLVLDIPAKLAGLSITEVPEVGDVLQSRYCRLPSVQGRGFRVANVWVLRGGEPCPPPPPDETPEDRSERKLRLDLFAPKKGE